MKVEAILLLIGAAVLFVILVGSIQGLLLSMDKGY